MKKDTHIFYNILMPIERILTLLVFAFNEHGARRKRIHYIGIAVVCLLFAAGLAYQQSVLEFNSLGNILTGLVLAALSYLHLRSISLNSAGQSITVFYFGLASFVYFTLMISAMSSLPLALQIDNGFANKIYAINLVAYALWSLILITGILWKNQKT